MATIIFANYNYFCNVSFSCSFFYERNKNFLIYTGLIFTPEVFRRELRIFTDGAGGHRL